MASLKSLSPSEYIALANAVAFVIIDGKSAVDTINIGDFISLVGDIVVSAGAQKTRLEAASTKTGSAFTQEDLNNTITSTT